MHRELLPVTTEKPDDRIVTFKTGGTFAVAFSPDGLVLVVGGINRAQLWEVSSQRVQRDLNVASAVLNWPQAVSSLEFSPDGHLLATGTCVRLPSDASTVAAHAATVALSAISGVVAVGDMRNASSYLRLWNPRNGKPRFDCQLWTTQEQYDATQLLSIAFSPDGHNLASVGTNGALKIFDTTWKTPFWKKSLAGAACRLTAQSTVKHPPLFCCPEIVRSLSCRFLLEVWKCFQWRMANQLALGCRLMARLPPSLLRPTDAF